MKKKYALFLIGSLMVNAALAQVGIGTNTPNNTSMLEVQSNSKGFLLPRMSSVQRTSIASPATGLQVYDNNTNSLWYFNGTQWVNIVMVASFGDVKSGIQTIDHSGWILLDGRAINTLTATQQAAAASLGLVGNIPNATNSYLVQNGGAMGAVSGSNTVTLTQGNLPNVNFTGNTSNAGSHNHTTDPAAFNSVSAGNHDHWVDPPSTSTTPDGIHSHSHGDTDPNNQNGLNTGVGANGPWFGLTTRTTSSNGQHQHSLDIGGFASGANGNHSHSIDVPSYLFNSTRSLPYGKCRLWGFCHSR